MRIFVAEDSPLVRQRLLEMIADIPGATVVGHADTAASAIDGILASRPQFVLLDLKLADGSGFDVLRALSSLAPEIDCYMMSNFAADAYRRHAAALGARDFFDKSSELERMRSLLRRRAASGT